MVQLLAALLQVRFGGDSIAPEVLINQLLSWGLSCSCDRVVDTDGADADERNVELEMARSVLSLHRTLPKLTRIEAQLRFIHGWQSLFPNHTFPVDVYCGVGRPIKGPLVAVVTEDRLQVREQQTVLLHLPWARLVDCGACSRTGRVKLVTLTREGFAQRPIIIRTAHAQNLCDTIACRSMSSAISTH